MKELICITCPRGCRLMVDENLNVTGNNCPRGVMYAKTELTHPVRMVTSTIVLTNSIERLPVKTKDPIPKELIFKVMEEIRKTTAKAPIFIGDVIISNVCNTGVDVIAAKDIKR